MTGWRIAAAAAAIALLGGRAEAQTPPPSDTLLHLSTTGTVQVSPDQLVADLVAQSTSPSAAAAQRRVNALIADGMKMAQGIAGVDVRAIGYSVAPGDDKRTSWVAQQTLELRGADGPSLLDLAGRLQEHGLAAAALDWQLSPALRRRAHDDATIAALKEMQARAASAAAALGLHIDHLQDVRLDGPVYQPRPMMAMARAASPAPAPQATAAPEDVTANVSADLVLRP